MNGYFEVYRGMANAWECDIMGHLNVQFYKAKTSEAVGHVRAAFGMTPSYIARQRHAMVAVSSLGRYRRELRAGDTLYIRAAVLAVGNKTISFVTDIINAETGELSCSYDITCASFDMESRRAVPWPPEMREKIESLVTERADRPRAPSTGGASAAGKTAGRPMISARGTVMTWECDEFGHMSAHFYVASAANGIGHIKDRFGFSRSVALERNWGSAALEYDIRFLRELKAGDIWTLRSGLVDIGRKVYRFGHVLTDDSTGEVCATFDVIGCILDLEARRSAEIPDDMRRRGEEILVPWPPSEWPERFLAD